MSKKFTYISYHGKHDGDQYNLFQLCSLNPLLFMFYLMQNCKIHHSVVGLRSCISEGAVIEDTLLMGADYYEVKPAVDEIFVTYSMTEKKKHPIFYE